MPAGAPGLVIIRRPNLVSSMSRYLIDRIEADPHIEVLTDTEVRGLAGETTSSRSRLEHTPPDGTDGRTAAACSASSGRCRPPAWLAGRGPLDRNGFVLTDRSSRRDAVDDPFRRPRSRCRSRPRSPGVFAVGDVRQGSMKRVAAAVGEGSSAVRSVHEYLATTA